MDKASAEAAFSLKRTSNGATVSGSFSWNGNEMTFTPNAALNGTTSYTATVGAGARDTAGTNLAAAKSWQFTTAAQPIISTVMPFDGATEVLPDALAIAIFDTAMDKPSAEAAFSLKRTSDGASVAGSFGWYGNALIFQPKSLLRAAPNTRQRSRPPPGTPPGTHCRQRRRGGSRRRAGRSRLRLSGRGCLRRDPRLPDDRLLQQADG